MSEPALVERQLAKVLRIRDGAAPGGSGGPTLTDRLVDHLATRRTLVLFDNCEHLVEACAELAAALLGACRDLTILLLRVPETSLVSLAILSDTEQIEMVDSVLAVRGWEVAPCSQRSGDRSENSGGGSGGRDHPRSISGSPRCAGRRDRAGTPSPRGNARAAPVPPPANPPHGRPRLVPGGGGSDTSLQGASGQSFDAGCSADGVGQTLLRPTAVDHDGPLDAEATGTRRARRRGRRWLWPRRNGHQLNRRVKLVQDDHSPR